MDREPPPCSRPARTRATAGNNSAAGNPRSAPTPANRLARHVRSNNAPDAPSAAKQHVLTYYMQRDGIVKSIEELIPQVGARDVSIRSAEIAAKSGGKRAA